MVSNILVEINRSTNPIYRPRPYAAPIEVKDSSEKPIKGFSISGNNFIESDNKIYSFDQLFNRSLGFTYVTGDEYRFHRFFLEGFGEERTRDLMRCREIKIDNTIVKLQTNGFNYISVRQGNKYGKIVVVPGMGGDSSSCEMVAQQILQDLNTIFPLKNFEPSIKVGEKMLRTLSNSAFFNVNDIGKQHLDRAINAFDGGRFEAFSLGSFSKVYSCDINAAYLSELQNIPNLSPNFVDWEEDNSYRPEALAGYIECIIDMPKEKIGKVSFRALTEDGNERLFFPTGVVTHQTITKTEYEFLTQRGTSVHIINASWAMPKYFIDYPFRKLVNSIIEMKKYPVLKQYRKNLYSKLWGKMASPSSLIYNPFYASELTSRLRSKITDLALKNEDNILGVKVDTVQFDREVSVDIGDDMGELREDHNGPAIICNDFYTHFIEENEDRNWFMGDDYICLKSQPISINEVVNSIFSPEDIGKVREWNDSKYSPMLSQYGSCKRMHNKEISREALESGKIDSFAPESKEDMETILRDWKGEQHDLF